MREYTVAVVGASGAVGQEMLKVLEQRHFPVKALRAMATKKSAGEKIVFAGQAVTLEDVETASFKGVDVALFAGGEIASSVYAPRAVADGAVVIDNSSHFRMDPTVPLVVPEVNPDALRTHRGIIANPNCSTIQMVVVLKPIHDRATIKRVVVTSFQAVSGTGKAAMEELQTQMAALVRGEKAVAAIYPHQIALNVLPQIGSFGPDGYSEEEKKLMNETRKIMGDDSIAVSATTVRVPVLIGHSETLNIQTEKPLTADEVRTLLGTAPGIKVVDDPNKSIYPLPIHAAGNDDVLVGRIRLDPSQACTIDMWIAADNLRKGAALNAVQIAEAMQTLALVEVMTRTPLGIEASRILVQKFGGTSVASIKARAGAIARIKEIRQRGFLPVVVVSAMGRVGEPYATDTLLGLVEGYNGARDKQDVDLLMSCGELISVVVMAHELRKAGLAARAMTGFQAGIITDWNFGEALIRYIDTERILAVLEDGQIPVIAGFQGMTEDGEVTTLGRGGSDTTAVALGAALESAGVVIYTDVDGILTGDPKLYPEARTVPEVTYEEAGELSVEGAKVLHPRCVDLAAQFRVPLWVRSTMMQGGGTRVSHVVPKDALEKTRVVTSIVAVSAVTQLQVLEADPDVRVRLFTALAEAAVSLDVINVTPTTVYFMVRTGQSRETVEVLHNLEVRYLSMPGCAKISIVGIGMRGTPGVMARIQKALWDARVEVLHSTDSNITISCLVRDDRVADAVAALHQEFGLTAGVS